MSNTKSKIWYVQHPTFVFNEDVKALARQQGLKVVDAVYDAGDGADDVPKLTLRDEYKPAKKVEPKKPEETDKAKALTVDQIKEKLIAKNVTIPDGVTKKADLEALLAAHPD